MFASTIILAQKGFDPGDLIYLAILLLSMLGGFGKWIRDRSAAKEEESEAPDVEKSKIATLSIRQRPATRVEKPAPAHPVRTKPTKSKPSPEEILTQVFRAVMPTPRDSTTEPGATPTLARHRAEPAKPPRRRPARARRAKPRSPQQEVQALKKMMKQTREAKTAPPSPMAMGDWTSLSVAELRRAIVLKEVLGPPVALRGSTHF